MSTPHQRLHIRTLLYELDISVRFVTDDLKRYAEAAGIKESPHLVVGERIDAFLAEISNDQAKALAQELLTGEGVA